MGLHAKTGTIGNVTVSSVELNAEAITGIGAAAKTLADLLTAIAAQGTGQLAKEAGGNLATLTAAVATLKAATDIIGTAGTLAKETGGNLATVKTNTDTLAAAVASLKAATDIIGTAGTLAKETGGNLAAIALAQAHQDYVISFAKKLTLTGQSTLLKTALYGQGNSFPAGALRLIFIPGAKNNGVVKIEINAAATADSPEVATISEPYTPAVANTLYIVGTENELLTVKVCIARA
jgi:hypothetical protein